MKAQDPAFVLQVDAGREVASKSDEVEPDSTPIDLLANAQDLADALALLVDRLHGPP